MKPLWKWLRAPRGRDARAPAPRAASKTRLSLELLEERVVLSTTPSSPFEQAHQTWRAERFSINEQITVVHQSLTHDSWRRTRVSTRDRSTIDGVFAAGDAGSQWMAGDTLIGLDRVAAGYPYRGQGYSVAVIDTGIDYNHPALGGGWGKRVIAGWDFVNNDSDPMDDDGHGTHVAGIIGSSDTNYAGVAPNVNLVALKVLDASGAGSFGAIEDALRWVADHQAQYHIVAINLSLGSGNYTSNPYTFLDDEFSTLNSQGVFIAVASGNSYYAYNSQVGLSYPAIDPYAVSVGAVWAGSFGAVSWQSGAQDYTTAADRITSFTQRSSGLEILAPGALITSTYPGGGFETMAGTSMATPFVAGAAAILHQALDANGLGAYANESYILSKMQATGVSVVDGDDENDNVTNTGLTFKRLDLYAALNSIQVANHPPVLSAIPSQTLRSAQSSLTLTLTASDQDNNPLRYSARLVGPVVQNYQLDQQYGLSYMGGYYANFQGHGEKWLQGSDAQYFILPDGQFRRWRETNYSYGIQGLVANLDPSVYNDPSLLWNAKLPGLSFVGNQLTLTANGYAGTFSVEATVSDGIASAARTFTVSVSNSAPVWSSLANQTMPSTQDKLTVTLTAADADGDRLTYSGRLQNQDKWARAYQLKQQYGLSYMGGGYYTNFQGHQEKWLQGSDAQYFILPNGELRRWHDSVYSYGPLGLVATFDATYCTDPSLLWNAKPVPVLSVLGNQLTIDPAAGYTGSFVVEVTASDGAAATTSSFTVTVSGSSTGNSPPALAAIADQTLSGAQNRLTLNLSASDANGDRLTFSARTTRATNTAYELDQQLGLYSSGSYYQNAWGLNEKWLLGNGAQWYLILPNGELRRWTGDFMTTMTSAALIATLRTGLYADPSLLWNAGNQAPAVRYSFTGNQITIERPGDFTGTVVVEVTVSDGQATATRTFTVTIS